MQTAAPQRFLLAEKEVTRRLRCKEFCFFPLLLVLDATPPAAAAAVLGADAPFQPVAASAELLVLKCGRLGAAAGQLAAAAAAAGGGYAVMWQETLFQT
jgi:hypothetical protein